MKQWEKNIINMTFIIIMYTSKTSFQRNEKSPANLFPANFQKHSKDESYCL